ncbi:MAG: hypothetical protein WBC44_21825 [Planctomycetaceae bacterium]
MLRLVLSLIICPAALAAVPACAGDMTIDGVEVGFGGAYRVGEWTPLAVRVTSESDLPESVVLETVTADADGSAVHRTTEPLPLERDGSTAAVRTVFQSGRADSPLTIRLKATDGTVLAERRLLARSPQLPTALPKGAACWVIAGKFDEAASDVDESAPPWPADITSASLTGPLPTDALAYAAVNVLVIRGDVAVSPEQSEALRRWVAGGGHVAITLGRFTDAYRNGSLSGWVPIEVGEPVQLRDVSALENFPRRARVRVARLDGAAENLPSGSDTPLVALGPYGFGRVTLFAMDLDTPPFSGWTGLPDLIREGVVGDEVVKGQSRRIASPGMTDLATQLLRAEQSFPGLQRRSVGSALVLLVLIAAIVGPLDYVIVHHLLRRPALTWITLPLIVLATAWWLHRSAVASNGTASRFNELHVLDVDATTGTLRGRTTVTLYAADSTRVDLAVTPDGSSDWGDGDGPAVPHLGWLAPPETTLGGRYREASGGLFQPEYRFLPAGEAAAASDVPMLIWGSRQFEATWQRSDASKLVEADLQTTVGGSIDGTIIHQLPGPLLNYLVAYGDRVFLAQPGAEWYPGEPIRPASSVFQRRDLDAFLTRKTTTQVERKPGEGGEDFVVSESVYDRASTDLADVMTMLTFHAAAGGRGYTGLTNTVLAADDLSSRLHYGRAIVLGQLESSAGEVAIAVENGKAFEPARRTTFVRLVLPVTRPEPGTSSPLSPLAPTEETPPERPPRQQ